MTIATDRTGENIAFGTTVPIITPATKDIDVFNYCETIARKLAAQLDDDAGSIRVPVPVKYVDQATYFDMQETALRAALRMTKCLHDEGFTVLSCTPAAMSDSHDEALDSITTGYMLIATRTDYVAQLMDEQDSYPGPTLWTSYARHTYGKAAIEEAMNEMRTQMKAAMADSADNATTH